MTAKVSDTFESLSNQFLQGVTEEEQETIRAVFAKIKANLQKAAE